MRAYVDGEQLARHKLNPRYGTYGRGDHSVYVEQRNSSDDIDSHTN
jgi:hypothetical protein